MHQDAVCVEIIVGIAANVPAPIDEKHTLPEDRRDSLGEDRARETRPDNQPAMHTRCHSTQPIGGPPSRILSRNSALINRTRAPRRWIVRISFKPTVPAGVL